jgi:hypothetical protein
MRYKDEFKNPPFMPFLILILVFILFILVVLTGGSQLVL